MAGQSSPDLVIELLNERHDRGGFSCGVVALDRYLKTQAGQDMRRRANGVFVLASAAEPEKVLGFYTLCALSLEPGDVPQAARKFIPRYPKISATLIGRLAVSKEHQGKRLGAMLLADALNRSYALSAEIGSCMVVVDALDEKAAEFYAAYGFVRLEGSRRLIVPIPSIPGIVG